ncbi:MAG TPA: biopolymer transporter ExbD [Thiohalobacter sp.]|nr:biopolymer transporter ExbD [Thiohalobacter sp.]
MRLRTRERAEPDVNLTPLIDVVFLLLIFFMISTTFEHEAQLQVDLPEASTKATEAPPERLEVTIKGSGDIYINDQQVVNTKPETIKRAIEELLGDKRDLPMVIRADSDSALQYAVTLMDIARQLEIKQVSLATVQTDAGQ